MDMQGCGRWRRLW